MFSARLATLGLISVFAIVLAGVGIVATAPSAQADGPYFADSADSTAPFYAPIQWMGQSGLSTGTAQAGALPLYKPLDAVSRQAMAAFIYRLSGDTFAPPDTPSFADVDASSQFYVAVEWMAARGISMGTPQLTGKPLFQPAKPVSRQSMALFLAREYHAALAEPGSQAFADVPIDSTPSPAIAWMSAVEISTGTTQPYGLPLFKPLAPVSRQAMAAFLFRLAHLAWGKESFAITIVPGTSSALSVSFFVDNTAGISFDLTGDISSFLSLSSGAIAPAPGGRWSLPILANAPLATAGIFHGGLRMLGADGQPKGSLPVAVTIVAPDATTIPTSISAPSPASVSTFAGTPIATGEIDIQVTATVADPTTTVRRIAAASSAVIIGSDPIQRIYQLRVAESDPTVLSHLADGFSSDSELTTAFLPLASGLDSDPVNDARWAGQWSTPGGDNWAAKMVHANDAWQLNTGAGVDVGVVDGGFDTSHEDLRANVKSASPLGSEVAHGTHVAGLLCASGNNGVGIAGIAYDCRLHLNGVFFENVAELVSAMSAVAKTSTVVNMSIGISPDHDCTSSSLTSEQVAYDNQVLKTQAIFRRVIEANPGVLWVMSAGNGTKSGVPIDARCGTLGALGGLPNVISVAALNRTGALASYSNRGPGVTVAAPGGDFPENTEGMLSSVPTPCGSAFDWQNCAQTSYGVMSGTSMASPIVAGIAALVKGENATLNPAQIKQCIIAAAEKSNVQIPGQTFYLANARYAVECAARLAPPPTGVGRVISGLGGPNAVAVDDTRGRLYVTTANDGVLHVYDALSGAVIHSMSVNDPTDVAVDRVTNQIFVSNSTKRTVTQIDGTTWTTSTIPIYSSPPNHLTVDETRNELWVSGIGIIHVDISTGSVLSGFALAGGGGTGGVAVNETSGYTYVADSQGTAIITKDRWIVSAETGVNSTDVALNMQTHLGYVSGMDPNPVSGNVGAVAYFNEQTLETHFIDTGGIPPSIAVDSSRNLVYTTSGEASPVMGAPSVPAQLIIINGATNTISRHLDIGYSLTDVAVNQLTGDVYVVDSSGGTVTIVR